MPQNAMTMPYLLQVSMTCWSRMEPPGWTMAVTPERRARSMLSPKGKKASEPRQTPVTWLRYSFLFLRGQGGGLLGEGLGPDIVADDILGVYRRYTHQWRCRGWAWQDIVTEGQVQHLVHVAQLPVVGLLAPPDGYSGYGFVGRRPRRWSGRLRCSRHCWTGCISGVMRAMTRSRFCSSVTLLFSVTQLVSMVSALMASSLRPCSKVMPYTCLCSTGVGLVVRVDGDHVVVALFLAGEDGASASGS